MKWNTLLTSTEKVNDTSLKNADASTKVSNLALHYYKGVKTLTFTGEIKSSVKAAKYSCIVTFTKVDADENLTDEEVMQGFYPKPSLSENDIQVRCSCPSYRFRYSYQNSRNSASTGSKVKAYTSKHMRPSVNPKNLPGVCKHLIEFVNYLVENGFIFE